MNSQWLPVYISLLTPIITFAVVMVGFLFNNRRIDDLVASNSSRMNELQRAVEIRLTDFKDLLRSEVGRLETKLEKTESALLSKFAELDTRLNRIESQLQLR